MILVTVDTSPISETALPTAVDIARRFGEPLTVLLVIDGQLRHHFDEVARRDGTTIEAVAQAHLDRVRSGLAADGVEVRTSWRHAVDAAEAIVETARDDGASLIVMATHGRTGLFRMLTGSVAEHTIRSSPVPVVVVPARDA